MPWNDKTLSYMKRCFHVRGHFIHRVLQEKIEPGLLLAGKKIAPFEAVSEAGAFEYPVQVPQEGGMA